MVLLPALVNGFPVKALAHEHILSNILERSYAETDKVLVIVQLFGGNDGLNTLIPLDQYHNYFNARRNLAIDENKVLPITGTNKTGFHPSLTGFRDLFNEGKLSILQSVGYPQPDLSHFRSTDIWMSGADAHESLNSGWAGRYLNQEYPLYPQEYPNPQMKDPLAIQIGTSTSFVFQGSKTPMAVNIADPQNVYNLGNTFTDPAPKTKAGEELKFVRFVAQQSQSYSHVIKKAADTVTKQSAYPDQNKLAQQLKIVARLIKGGLKTKIYLVSFDGFDTHAQQVNAGNTSTGMHADLLKTTGDAIKAFQDDLEFLNIDKRVIGMTFSEFGRRIISNDSLGTDHGAAAPLFVFGEGVEGEIFGQNPLIKEVVTNEDNIPMQIDFRQVYATLLRDWMSVPSSFLNNILYKEYTSLPFIRASR